MNVVLYLCAVIVTCVCLLVFLRCYIAVGDMPRAKSGTWKVFWYDPSGNNVGILSLKRKTLHDAILKAREGLFNGKKMNLGGTPSSFEIKDEHGLVTYDGKVYAE